MPRIIHFEVIEHPDMLMIGRYEKTDFGSAGQVWQDYLQSDLAGKLKRLARKNSLPELTSIDMIDAVGCLFDFREHDCFDLLMGQMVPITTKVPEDVAQKRLAKGRFAHFQIQGETVAEIIAASFSLMTAHLEKAGLSLPDSDVYWCEVYTESFSKALANKEPVTMYYLLPVRSS